MKRWDDPSLRVAGDTRQRARYRLLQSWWRETQLEVPPGSNGRQEVGSLLPERVAAVMSGLNYLSPAAREKAGRRVPRIQAEGGTVDVRRLAGNLLSSQPLAFNVFGHLRAHPRPAARVLSEVFGVAIDQIAWMEVEWAPPRDEHLGDRTAFDAFVAYRTGGRPGFLGIEVKYTEPFSPTPYDRPRYRAVAERSGVFAPGAADRLAQPATNQLWRQTLLALSLAATGGHGPGSAAILSMSGDGGVAQAVAGVSAEVTDESAVPLVGTVEDLVAGALRERALRPWAQALHRRYVDLSPVAATGD